MKMGAARLGPSDAEPVRSAFSPAVRRVASAGCLYYDAMRAAGPACEWGAFLKSWWGLPGSREGASSYTPELPGTAAAVDVEPMSRLAADLPKASSGEG